MAGRIPETDVAHIKERVNIVDLVSDYVTLKRAGVATVKGLCPFHDEKTPSFTVNPQLGRYHCFGCQASGDAIAFLMQYQHLSFVEVVEALAARINYTINYAESDNSAPQGPSKTRLYQAHAAASAFFQAFLEQPEAQIARDFLTARGFNAAAAQQFQLGYAPESWNMLTDYLRKQGFTAQELLASGIAGQGSSGIYAKFRGRIIWPISDLTGQIIGFGARKLLEKDQGPKYLNSSDSPIYHKAQVLYGLEKAKKSIAKQKSVVIVEGYTDVMACHLAGVTNAVATCGTAFGKEHIAVLRRVLGDDPTAEVIFTFDPDGAGQKAALKAYAEEKSFLAQTYVADNRSGLDPADLRQQQGDSVLKQLFTQKIPLFEFALRNAVSGFDLFTITGRQAALEQAAPIVAAIRHHSLKEAYTRELARMLGMEIKPVMQQVAYLSKQQQRQQAGRQQQRAAAPVAQPAAGQPPVTMAQLPRNRQALLERHAVMALLQYPTEIPQQYLERLSKAQLEQQPLQMILETTLANFAGHLAHKEWLNQLLARLPAQLRVLLQELVLQPLPASPDLPAQHQYAREITVALLIAQVDKVKTQLRKLLTHPAHGSVEEQNNLHALIAGLETERRELLAAKDTQ